jgi:hypothetical protein
VLTLTITAAITAGCSTESSFDDEPVSWECLRVKTLVDLTSSMPVGEARSLLDALTRDARLTLAEAEYATDLLGALDGIDDAEELGDHLDGVPCDL